MHVVSPLCIWWWWWWIPSFHPLSMCAYTLTCAWFALTFCLSSLMFYLLIFILFCFRYRYPFLLFPYDTDGLFFLSAFCFISYWSWFFDKPKSNWILWIFPWSVNEIKVRLILYHAKLLSAPSLVTALTSDAYSLEGQVKKTLTVSPINDGSGYFFNLGKFFAHSSSFLLAKGF